MKPMITNAKAILLLIPQAPMLLRAKHSMELVAVTGRQGAKFKLRPAHFSTVTPRGRTALPLPRHLMEYSCCGSWIRKRRRIDICRNHASCQSLSTRNARPGIIATTELTFETFLAFHASWDSIRNDMDLISVQRLRRGWADNLEPRRFHRRIVDRIARPSAGQRIGNIVDRTQFDRTSHVLDSGAEMWRE